MIMKYKPQQFQRSEGFALLIAVVVASILLSITYVMFNITIKQITLSTAGKNSQFALYAADTGIECALHAVYNISDTEFATQQYPNGNGDPNHLAMNLLPGDGTEFNCLGTTIIPQTQGNASTVTVKGTTYNYPKAMVYTFTVKSPSGSCANVTISKYVINIPTGVKDHYTEIEKTKIDSRGYNTCPDLNPTDPQRVERGLEVFF
jgi:hypothetical protein